MSNASPTPDNAPYVPDITLDRSSPVPLYFQISEPIAQLINSGALPANTRLEDELSMAARLRGETPPDFPRETAIGALAAYISDESVTHFQPMNVNFGIMQPLGYRVKGKANKNLAIANRSLERIDAMLQNEKEERHEDPD